MCDWVAQLLGLPDGWHGHIEDAASTSTLAALIAARHVTGRNVAVGSEHAHSALEKGARMLGMELRTVPADDEYRMRTDGLDLSDAAIVVPTVGTTSTASVDPVPAVADLCAQTGTWLHVDAAYAGSAMVCEEHRWAFAGVERADSLVVNAHKWMLTPMDCSLLWTSRPEDFRSAFSLVPEFLRTPDAEDALSLSEYGPVLGRRFRSLKLWAVLRCHGREGLQRMIREHVRLAGRVRRAGSTTEPGWELAAPQRFSLVCFRRDGSDEENAAILERANASGELFISHTRLDGRYVLRLAIGSERTTEDDVRRAWDAIRAAAAKACPELERPAEGDVRVEGDRLVLDQPQLRPALDQPRERELRLELAEARAGAVVDALAEREVVVGVLARGVERVGLGEDVGVAPGRREPEEQLRALGQVDAAERRRLRGDPPPHRHRGVVAQRLVDRAGDQLAVGHDRLPARSVLQQPPDQVADQVVRRLVAGEREREQDRGDLLVGERLGVLVVDGEQRARVVVGAVVDLALTSARR